MISDKILNFLNFDFVICKKKWNNNIFKAVRIKSTYHIIW